MDAEVTLIAALDATVEVLPALDADVTLVPGSVVIGQLLTGLIAYYRCEEASGILIDAHTGDNDLDDVNTVGQASPGKVGDARNLNESNNEYFQLANASAGNFQMGLNDMTWAGWVRFTTSPGQKAFPILMSFGGGSSTEAGYQVRVYQNLDRILLRVSDGATRHQGAPGIGLTLSAATWYYIIVEWDRDGAMNMYIDDGSAIGGKDISSFVADDIQATVSLFLGKDNHCDKDEVAMWSRLLTAAEKTWLAAGRSWSEVQIWTE